MGRSDQSVRRHRQNRFKHVLERIGEVRRELRYLSPADGDAAASEDPRHIEAQVMKDYHRLEKGLSLREPRSGFGSEPRARLLRDVGRARRARLDPSITSAADQVLSAHELWNTDSLRRDIGEGGVVRHLDPASIRGALVDPEAFFGSRHSIRDFDKRGPERSVLERAVRLAQSAPSVCNRQAVGVDLYTKPEDVLSVLSLQSGNRGFREFVPSVFVVHVDTRLFSVGSERNQKWVDGGLFAMTLVLGLHSLGLVTCMLNWAVENDLHSSMRSLLGLPEHRDIVMLIAAGYPPPDFYAARSARRALEEVLTVDAPLHR